VRRPALGPDQGGGDAGGGAARAAAPPPARSRDSEVHFNLDIVDVAYSAKRLMGVLGQATPGGRGKRTLQSSVWTVLYCILYCTALHCTVVCNINVIVCLN